MNKKGIILFDVDRTLLDIDKISTLRNEAILKILNTTDFEEVKSIKGSYRATLKNERDYVPEDYIKLLSDNFDFRDRNLLLDTYYGKNYANIYEESVFPEVREVLNKSKTDYQLGIYSEGTNRFQTNKFRSMGLNRYFDKDLIFIFDAKDTEEAIKKIPKDVIVVDDKERICKFLDKHGIRAIWLNKKDDGVSPDFPTIHNLLELPAKLM